MNRYTTHMLLCISFIVTVACEQEKRGLVVGKIQQASDLASTEFTIDKIVHGTKTRKLSWFIKLSEARFLAYSQAKIKAGIDLSQIGEEDIRIEGRKISLSLPPVKVVNFSYPPSSFIEDSLISDTRALLSKINIEDQEEFFRQAELDIRSNLKYMGIVEATQQHTRDLLAHLLQSLGYEEIYITFASNELVVEEVRLLPTEIENPDSND
ncbi:DUF4230 domain-containing protein [Porifericola rhodea]|uniref:DUF4230 domain-containing protein n=1 Tax=Porifericola rhodea TaxID=930972 RepID=UPI002666E4ED|nr:DUF4230 domain-containing protein [Porifericola rhodea]WKN33294.1 DUF4230 domain-containing protein [Porifericola rhodea]